MAFAPVGSSGRYTEVDPWESFVRLSASVRSELDDFDRRESAPGLHLSDERAVSGSRLGNALSPVRDASGKTAI